MAGNDNVAVQITVKRQNTREAKQGYEHPDPLVALGRGIRYLENLKEKYK